MNIVLDPNSIGDYKAFIAAKALPMFRCVGHEISFPDEYASRIGLAAKKKSSKLKYVPSPFLFDYQHDVSALSIAKQKFGLFIEPGLGKTNCGFEFIRHVARLIPEKRILWLSPLGVIRQTISECARFYGSSLHMDQVRSRDLQSWLNKDGGGIGICNYDALDEEISQGNLGALVLDESSVLSGAYGVWSGACLRLGDGLEWKLCLTGTPAPNDRIEYANHAVFLDVFPTVNSFYARYFVNKGQTQERWQLKPHAVEAFFRDMSHWAIFVTNPATYGWKDNTDNIPPIYVHIHDIDLTDQQRQAVHDTTNSLFVTNIGGIADRSRLSRIGKGDYNGERIDTNKSQFIRDLVDTWPEESTIIWTHYNNEQDEMERIFPEAVSVRGDTPYEIREQRIDDFKTGRKKIIISKSKCIGFGLNLQVCTRQVFSGLQDSYIAYYQAVKRANRVGSIRPLNVHIPVTEIEMPMIRTVLDKAHRIQQDTELQESLFKQNGILSFMKGQL